MALKAALSKAAGRIAPNHFETEARTCIECGASLESWQASRCQACIGQSVAAVVIANSQRWQTCDGVVVCADCFLRDTPECTAYQAELTDIGRGDDVLTAVLDFQAEKAAKISKIESILTGSQPRGWTCLGDSAPKRNGYTVYAGAK